MKETHLGGGFTWRAAFAKCCVSLPLSTSKDSGKDLREGSEIIFLLGVRVECKCKRVPTISDKWPASFPGKNKLLLQKQASWSVSPRRNSPSILAHITDDSWALLLLIVFFFGILIKPWKKFHSSSILLRNKKKGLFLCLRATSGNKVARMALQHYLEVCTGVTKHLRVGETWVGHLAEQLGYHLGQSHPC